MTCEPSRRSCWRAGEWVSAQSHSKKRLLNPNPPPLSLKPPIVDNEGLSVESIMERRERRSRRREHEQWIRSQRRKKWAQRVGEADAASKGEVKIVRRVSPNPRNYRPGNTQSVSCCSHCYPKLSQRLQNRVHVRLELRSFNESNCTFLLARQKRKQRNAARSDANWLYMQSLRAAAELVSERKGAAARQRVRTGLSSQ